MRQLVIQGGSVLATHAFGQDLWGAYPGSDIVLWEDDTVLPGDPDPRTREQKRNNYADKRRMAYPSIQDQLDMIYWDGVHGQKGWMVKIEEIKRRYPKPEAESVQEKNDPTADYPFLDSLLDSPGMRVHRQEEASEGEGAN